MKEPQRLSEDRSPASAKLRALLAAAEPPQPLPAATRERVRRALAGRAAAAERKAVCWSHAFGLALALATCVAWLSGSQRDPGTRGLVARAPAAPTPPAPAAAFGSVPELERAAHAEPAGAAVPVELRAAPPVAERSTVKRRSARAKRFASGAERSRKRIEALVDDILKPEAQLLDRAKREVERDPEQALALIETYRRRHPDAPIPAPSVVVEVDALRRLGRFDDALAKARALVAGSHRDYYADEMAERFALLDL